MTEKRLPEDKGPLPGGRETGRSGGRRPGKKVRRVSQRRELAVVTLGAVAAITGLGGVMATNSPGWATTAATTPAEMTAETRAPEAPAPAESGSASVEPSREQREAPAQQTPAQQAPRQQQAAPAYSAPSQAPAAAESRGS